MSYMLLHVACIFLAKELATRFLRFDRQNCFCVHAVCCSWQWLLRAAFLSVIVVSAPQRLVNLISHSYWTFQSTAVRELSFPPPDSPIVDIPHTISFIKGVGRVITRGKRSAGSWVVGGSGLMYGLWLDQGSVAY